MHFSNPFQTTGGAVSADRFHTPVGTPLDGFQVFFKYISATLSKPPVAPSGHSVVRFDTSWDASGRSSWVLKCIPVTLFQATGDAVLAQRRQISHQLGRLCMDFVRFLNTFQPPVPNHWWRHLSTALSDLTPIVTPLDGFREFLNAFQQPFPNHRWRRQRRQIPHTSWDASRRISSVF